jgi:hypothetical protein
MRWKRVIERTSDILRVSWVWMLSFANAKRTIANYPLRFRHYDNSAYGGPARLRPVDWTVQVIRWTGMQGHGATKEEAMQNLRENFSRFEERGEPLPRPGSYKGIEFASSEKIERFPDIEKDFIAHILNVEWAWLTDESSLWDFSQDETLDEFYSCIRTRYAVDVSDIEGAKLVSIFERIDRTER